MNYHLRMTGEQPMPPTDADLAFTIDFKKGEGNPRRVFDAASDLIEAFEVLDSALAVSIDKAIEPLLVLEDVEAGSLKVWLKNILTRVEDEALRTLDWKPLIGRFLVKAKYIVLEFCDSDQPVTRLRIDDLKSALRRLAEETDVRHLPDYPVIHEARLITAVDKIQDAKRDLGKGDRLFVESEDRLYEVNLSNTGSFDGFPDEAPGPETQSEGEMILTVRKPDLLRDSMWQFVHGKHPISASILDEKWLEEFHNRKIPIFPGDALRCRVRHTYFYNDQKELTDDKIEILKVLERIAGPPPQTSFI